MKARYGDKSFSDLVQMLGNVVLMNNEMLSSMYEAKKTSNMLGMKYEKIHACLMYVFIYK